MRVGARALSLAAIAALPPCPHGEPTPKSGASASLSQSAAPSADRVRATLPDWSIATTLRDPPARLQRGVADVVAHVPAGLDPDAPLHLVVYFHGSDVCVAQTALVGSIVCTPGSSPQVGAGLVGRHDDAGTMSVFAAPQLNGYGASAVGRFGEPGYFRRFVEQLVGETFVPGLGRARSLDDVADITLVGHSAGHLPLLAILAAGDLADRIDDVVLIDALYDGQVEPYVRWVSHGLGRQTPRKLAAVYGPWGRQVGAARSIVEQVERMVPGSTDLDPAGSVEDAIHAHAVTMKPWVHLDHGWIEFLTMSKMLAGLGLPPRDLHPPRVFAPNGMPPTRRLALDEDHAGELVSQGSRLENGALADDWSLDVPAGAKLVVDVRGQRSVTEPCCTLDVEAEIWSADRTRRLARDDDGGGGFDARLTFAPPSPGAYVLRVSTSGSGEKRGGYSVRASVAP